MNCKQCHETLDVGASFCGNCGAPVEIYNAPSPAQTMSATPAYAHTLPNQHRNEMKALLALLFGLMGMVGGIFVALVGIVLGLIGVILGTMSIKGSKRALSIVGITASCASIVVGIGVFTYVIKHDTKDKTQTKNQEITSVAAELNTPCYSVGFVEKLNISNKSDSCDMMAYNGDSLDSSTEAYKVYSSQTVITSPQYFNDIAKEALEKDVNQNLSGFEIDKQGVAAFAGNPAYVVKATNKEQGVKIIEAAVFHKTDSGANIFVLVHAVNDESVDLTTMESQWQWK